MTTAFASNYYKLQPGRINTWAPDVSLHESLIEFSEQDPFEHQELSDVESLHEDMLDFMRNPL